MAKMTLIIVAVVGLVLLAFGIQRFTRVRSNPAPNIYVIELLQIHGAKQAWALEHGKTTNDTPTWSQLLPYFGGEMTNFYTTNGVVVRPAGGVITIGRVGDSPSFLVDGHRIVSP